MTEWEFETVYLARHGQTQWNLAGRRQGRLDSPLTALGAQQVRGNAEAVAAEPIDAVFTSPLGRATASAAVFAQVLGLPLQVCEGLAEVDHGVMSGLTADEVESAFPGALEARKQDKYDWRFPGGESYADADARAALALAAVSRTGARRPLLVSHEMIGRMLLGNLAGLDHRQALALNHPSDVVYRVSPGSQCIERVRPRDWRSCATMKPIPRSDH